MAVVAVVAVVVVGEEEEQDNDAFHRNSFVRVQDEVLGNFPRHTLRFVLSVTRGRGLRVAVKDGDQLDGAKGSDARIYLARVGRLDGSYYHREYLFR